MVAAASFLEVGGGYREALEPPPTPQSFLAYLLVMCV